MEDADGWRHTRFWLYCQLSLILSCEPILESLPNSMPGQEDESEDESEDAQAWEVEEGNTVVTTGCQRRRQAVYDRLWVEEIYG